MTAAPPRRDDRQPPAAGPDQPPPKLGISLVQVLAAALAAATATIAASFLGVAGTVVGAALASVISVTGTALYSHSLRRTSSRVRQRVARPGTTATRPMRLPVDRSPLQGPGGSSPFDRPTLQGGGFAEPTYYGRRRTGPSRPAEHADHGRVRALWRRLAIAAVAIFVAVLAVLTGVELLAGQPISDLVRGRTGTGTTLFGTHRGSPTPEKTPQHSATPSGARTASSSPGASSTPAPTTSPPGKASAARSSATSPAPSSSTAVPSTASATPTPSPSVTSGSPTVGSARTQSAQP
jgi:hypothetical protein